MLHGFPSEKRIEVRDRGGDLVLMGSPHECGVLAEHGHIEGVFNRRGFRYVRLTVERRLALRKLRRRLCASGRTVAEDCQLTTRRCVPGGGVIYSHHERRCAGYAPLVRGGFAEG